MGLKSLRSVQVVQVHQHSGIMKTSIALVILVAAAVLAEDVGPDGAGPPTAPGDSTGPLGDDTKPSGSDTSFNPEGGKSGKSSKKSKSRSEDKAKSGDAIEAEHPHHHHHHHPHATGPYDMNAMGQVPCPYFLTPAMLYHLLLQQFPQDAQLPPPPGAPNYPNSPYPSVVQTIDPAFPMRPPQDGSAPGDVKVDDGSKGAFGPSIRELPPVAS